MPAVCGRACGILVVTKHDAKPRYILMHFGGYTASTELHALSPLEG